MIMGTTRFKMSVQFNSVHLVEEQTQLYLGVSLASRTLGGQCIIQIPENPFLLTHVGGVQMATFIHPWWHIGCCHLKAQWSRWKDGDLMVVALVQRSIPRWINGSRLNSGKAGILLYLTGTWWQIPYNFIHEVHTLLCHFNEGAFFPFLVESWHSALALPHINFELILLDFL